MPMPVTVGLIVVGVIVVALVSGAASRLVLLLMRGPLARRIAACYGRDKVLMEDLEANSFGRESEGLWRHRGNGGLVLTGECLHFFKFLPRSDFRIPVTAITGVALTKSHLGKATIFDLLKVQFLENGRSDSVAWYVADVHAWKDRIEVARRGAE